MASKEGAWRPEFDRVLDRFHACGDIARGAATFACLRPRCGEQRVVAFSCHTRQFCPSCQARRARSVGQRLATVADPRAPHRQVVFTLPRLVRPFLRRDRALQEQFIHVAMQSLQRYLCARTGAGAGMIGAFAVLQTFGQDLTWHPHLHVAVADGVFLPDGTFVAAPRRWGKTLEDLYVSDMRQALAASGRIPQRLLDLLARWRHSGFSAWVGEPCPPGDTASLERLGSYFARPPHAGERLLVADSTDTIILKFDFHPRLRRNFEVFNDCSFVAALLRHVPAIGHQRVRWFGWYSNRSRGRRQRRVSLPGLDLVEPALPADDWRTVLWQTWGSDPLRCPRCGGPMTLIAVRPPARRPPVIALTARDPPVAVPPENIFVADPDSEPPPDVPDWIPPD